MSEVRETQLPGTGVRYDFETREGVRLGVLLHRSGHREFLVYSAEDPDSCLVSVGLDVEDAATIVELMGGSKVVEAVGDAVQQRIQGLAIEWIGVHADSEVAGRSIGDAQLRTRTGASVVAVISGNTTTPSPTPDYVFHPGDTAVAVGTDDGLRALANLMQS